MSNTTILIRRSTTTAVPPSLANGELAFSQVSNSLFIGMPSGSGISPPIGGTKYPYLQQATVGSVTPNSVVIANSTGGISNIAIGDIKLTSLSANGSNGVPGQILTSNGGGLYWSTFTAPPGGSNTFVQYNDGNMFHGDGWFTYDKTISTLTVANGVVTGNLQINGIIANGSLGTANTILASNGSSTFWKQDLDYSTNVNATYTWTNNHLFSNVITFSNDVTLGNSTVNTTVNSTFYTGTANNTLFINGKSANTLYTKEWHVDPTNGVDSANTPGNILAPFKTLTYALTRSSSTGEKILLHQGIYSNDNPIITDLNIDIEGTGLFGSGTTYFPGTITVNATSSASSIRLRGIFVNTFVHSANSGVYLDNVQTRAALTKSGSGYLEVRDCDLQGASFAGVTTISGNGYSNFYATKIGTTVISNAAAIITMMNIPSILAGGITITAGTLNVDKAIGVPATLTSNVIAASAGTVVYVADSNFITSAGTAAKIALNGFYAVKNSVYDEATSTFGTSLQSIARSDNVFALNSIRVANSFTANTTALVFTGATVNATSANVTVRNVAITGNLTVNDSMIKIASNNTTDAVDIGFYGQHGASLYSGLYRKAGSNFRLFQTSTEPTTTVTGDTLGTLQAYLISTGLVANLSALTITANSTVSVSITANTLTLGSPLAITSGGTGLSTVGANGQILVSNGTAMVWTNVNNAIFI